MFLEPLLFLHHRLTVGRRTPCIMDYTPALTLERSQDELLSRVI